MALHLSASRSASGAVLGSAVFGIATTLTQDGAPVLILQAQRLLWRGVSNYVGRLAALLIVVGVIDAAVKVARRRASANELLYLGLVAIMWAIVLAPTLRRGGAVWGRYYMIALALTIPVVVACVYSYGRRDGVDSRFRLAAQSPTSAHDGHRPRQACPNPDSLALLLEPCR